MSIIAFTTNREEKIITNLDGRDLLDEDDVISGILFCANSASIYRIDESIAVLLSDKDIAPSYLISVLNDLTSKLPEYLKETLMKQIERITKLQISGENNWNSDEMKYYDQDVDTEQKRAAMLDDIRNIPVWRNFIPREKFITSIIKPFCNGQTILEVGSGNSRTIANIFRPKVNGYHYIGSDISYKRLLVAKKAIPEGDFIQASAANLPFTDDAFKSILSFGMLHHLPRPIDAVSECIKKLTKNGFFCFHEPIAKPKILGKGKSFLKKLIMTYEHSEHDGEIEPEKVFILLKVNGFEIVSRYFFISTFETFAEVVINKLAPKKLKSSKFVTNSLFTFDRMIINTLCRLWKGFGPRSVVVVARRKEL